jgi:TonB family protein
VGVNSQQVESSTQTRKDLLTSEDNTFQIFISSGVTAKLADHESLDKTEGQSDQQHAIQTSTAASAAQQFLLPESGALTHKNIKDRLLLGSPPKYSVAAINANLEGVITLKIYVSSYGIVTATEIIKSTGHVLLDAEAIEAVKFWAFETSTADKKAKENKEYVITFNFLLDHIDGDVSLVD